MMSSSPVNGQNYTNNSIIFVFWLAKPRFRKVVEVWRALSCAGFSFGSYFLFTLPLSLKTSISWIFKCWKYLNYKFLLNRCTVVVLHVYSKNTSWSISNSKRVHELALALLRLVIELVWKFIFIIYTVN